MNRIERNYYLNKLIERRDNGRVKVITGIRRCGKSVLLFDIYGDYLKAEGVVDEQLIRLKLDVARNARYRNPMELDKFLRDQIADSDKQYYVMSLMADCQGSCLSNPTKTKASICET